MTFVDKYVEFAKDALVSIDDELAKVDDKDLEDAIRHIVKENIKDPTINMDNDVKHKNSDTSLTKMCEWIDERQPIVSGNATFYCQHAEEQSPTANMMINKKRGRKQVKSEMFKLDPKSAEYAMKDLEQLNIKIIMNAEYGASGTPTAAFYAKYSPPATTLMAQSIITTMAAFFEGFIGDNQKFFHTNECIDWMMRVIKSKPLTIPPWMKIPTASETAMRIKKKFMTLSLEDNEMVNSFCNNRTQEELVYLYYANNIKEMMLNNSYIRDILYRILTNLPKYETSEDEVPTEFKDKFDNVKDYNKWVCQEMFFNPYNVPECISKDMAEFANIMHEYVFVQYITPDSIIKLNNHPRNTVLLVDTDSNIVNVDLFISAVLKEVFPNESFSRQTIYNEMITGNILAATLDPSIKDMLDYYARMHYVKDAEIRKELTMKNEFMFRRFFIMLTKKRYVASIVLREGNMMIPFKPEIKGVDFIKAAVDVEVSNRFQKILCERILYPEELQLHEMMKDLKEFGDDIYNDLKKGGTTYLKQQMYKPINGYANKERAQSLQVYRGSTLWNILFPDKKINSLDRVSILKLAIKDPSDILQLQNAYPNQYKMIMENVFNSPDPNVKKSGMSVICIPRSVKEIPSWIIPYIDYNIIISDIMGSFRSILDALEIVGIQYKTPNGNATKVSGLISI